MHYHERPYWPHSEPAEDPHPGATDCPGKCNAAYRAAEARVQLHGGEHDLEPRPGEPVWCAPCVTELRGALTDWPELASRLLEEIGSGVRAQAGEYVSGSKNRPIHEHEAPSLLLDELAEWLPEWAASIARDRGLPERPGARRGADPVAVIDDACAFLRIHLDWHLNGRAAQERQAALDVAQAARDFGDELGRYTRRARTITGSQEPEPVRIIGVACPNCDRKALEHEIEDSPTQRARVSRYAYREDGDVKIVKRAATDEEAALLRLRPPSDKHGKPIDPWAPTVPKRQTEPAVTNLQGAVAGYIRCRRCRPTFRMTIAEYHVWTQMLAAGDEARARATEDKLREIFGGSIPKQYRPKESA